MERLLRSSALVAVTVAYVLFAVTPANANRFASNPDHVVDRSVDTQFAPIGELFALTTKPGTTQTDVGTGFLVSPCYIMTAAHVVFDTLSPVRDRDYTMKFRAGPSVTSAFAGNTTATLVLSGKRTKSGGNDWAIMKLESCIGKRPEFGWPEAAHTDSKGMMGRNLVAFGYAADNGRGELSLGPGTAVGIEKRNNLIKFTGSVAPGQSGGPVLLRENGMMKVAAIAVAEKGVIHGATYPYFTDEHANLLQNAVEVLNDASVQAILNGDKAAFGQPNAAAERATGPLAGTQPPSQ